MIGDQRWRYRALAFKDDPAFWAQNHPRLARAVEIAYDRLEPVREHFRSIAEASHIERKIQAIRDVQGNRETGIKYWKYDGDAKEIYADAIRQGWTGSRNSVQPYTQRELRERDLGRWGLSADTLSTKTDAEIDALFYRELKIRMKAKKLL